MVGYLKLPKLLHTQANNKTTSAKIGLDFRIRRHWHIGFPQFEKNMLQTLIYENVGKNKFSDSFQISAQYYLPLPTYLPAIKLPYSFLPTSYM